MKIVILGATSRIAKDLLLSFSNDDKKHDFFLFCRDIKSLSKWIISNKLHLNYKIKLYSDFNNSHKFDAIINFVGVGDPAKAKIIGSNIFEITEKYDNIALDYIKSNKETKYINLSSGAIYSGQYEVAVSESTPAIIDINNISSTDWYSIAKLCVELRHRSLDELHIIDIRVFNYFSNTLDLSSRFFISDIIESIKLNSILKTSEKNIVRDYIGRVDFYKLIQGVLGCSKKNIAFDCYSKSPVDKMTLLSEMKKCFGLRYELISSEAGINATGHKVNYFSKSRKAKEFGYLPSINSLDLLLNETRIILEERRTGDMY